MFRLMHTTSGVRPLGLRAAALVFALSLGLSLLGPSAAEGGPIRYSVEGTVGGGGSASQSGIDYTGVANARLYVPGSLILGWFDVQDLPAGSSVTYSGLPFELMLSVDDGGDAAGRPELRIAGMLDGSIHGASYSDLQATIASITEVAGRRALPFVLDSFRVNVPQLIGPSEDWTDRPVLTGYIGQPIPEPTALATLGLGVAALLARRRFRRRRA